MRRLFGTSMLCIVLFLSGSCGGDDASPPDSGQGDSQDGGGAAQGTAVPECPFTEDQVIDIVGQPMTDEGTCLFGDGKGVASLTITTASELAGSAGYGASRDLAEGKYTSIKELGGGTKGYVAVDDLGGEAIAITKAGAFTVTMSSFERFDPAGYDETLRALVDAALDNTQ